MSMSTNNGLLMSDHKDHDDILAQETSPRILGKSGSLIDDPSPTTTNEQIIDKTIQQKNSFELQIGTIKEKDLIEIKREKKREVYRYETEWLISSVAWSNESGESFKLAISSYIEEYSNRVQLVKLTKDYHDQEIFSISTFEHPYPATKILWIPQPPDNNNQPTKFPQLLATTADYLRIWRVVEKKTPQLDDKISTNLQNDCDINDSHQQVEGNTVEVNLESLLNTNKGSKHCTPLTSFDWNDIDPSIIVTSSVDTTCAIWDLEMSKLIYQVPSHLKDVNTFGILRNQIVAHNHEVYDVSFSRAGSGRDIFASAGGDGSIRLFDLRRPTTSSLVYKNDHLSPSIHKALVRVACNKQEPNIISAFASESKEILILDVRKLGKPVASLNNHLSNLNSMSWASHSIHHLCTASDDQQALIWDLSKLPDNTIEEPVLAYKANGKINTISWSAAHSEWIAIGYQNCLELLRV